MREMKKTGISWFPLIPVDWQTGRIKDILSVLTDYTANGSFGDLAKNVTYLDYEDYARLVRLTDLRENLKNMGVYVDEDGYNYLSKSSLFGGEILVANVGAYAGLFCEMPTVDYPATLAPNMFLLRTNDVMLQHYLLYVGLSSFVWEQLCQKAISSAQPKLNKTDVKTTFIPIPPISEQKRIADYLDNKCAQFDSTISDIQSQIEALEEYKCSVITEAVTKGLDPDVEMRDSGVQWIGMIPKHWTVDNPKWHFVQRKDRATKGLTQLTASQKYGVVTQEEYMEITGAKVVTVEKDFDILKLVCPGDFIIHMRSFQGGLEYSEKYGSISSAYVMLIPQKTILEPRFYKWFFKSPVYIDALSSTSNLIRDGQAMRYANFIQLPIPLMPKEEQQQIADYLDSKCAEIDSIIAEKKQQIETIEEYKKSLIFEYVTGKKEVTQ